jgi:hypothetical protein
MYNGIIERTRALTTFAMSEETEKKLREKHNVVRDEVFQAFEKRVRGKYLQDTRPEHLTVPVTNWFISKTNSERELKVVFVYYAAPEDTVVIKTCYEPNEDERQIWLAKIKSDQK